MVNIKRLFDNRHHIPVLAVLFIPIEMVIGCILILGIGISLLFKKLFELIWKFPLRLVGYWWCVSCKKKMWGSEEKEYLLEHKLLDNYKHHKCCPDCEHKHNGRMPLRFY